MKDKNLLFSFLTFVFGSAFFLSAVASAPQQVGDQQLSGPADAIPLAGSFFSMIKSNQHSRTINPADILSGEQTIKKMHSGKEIGLNWTELGPDNYAGRSRSILVDKRDASGKTLFAGSVAGGVWKSTTGGLTWNQLNGTGINLNVSCMIQASNGDIYVGTGEDYTQGWGVPALLGRGIFKSTDGVSFSLLESTKPEIQSGNEWLFINELAGDPISGRIYAGTNTGLKYSDDNGSTWNFAHNASGENLSGIASDVKIASDGTVIASVNNQCMISQNGDPNNFQGFSNDAIPGFLPSTGIGRFEFAFAPSAPNVVYALAAFDGTRLGTVRGALENVYKSTDKGSSWTVIGPGGSPNFNIFGALNHGLYSNTITVFPNDPDRILAGGYNIWEGKKVLETGFYQWEQRTSSFVLHNDQHAYVFAPNDPGTIYVAGDGGLDEISNNFMTYKNINKTFNTAQFYSVAYSHKGELMGGTQGAGVLYIDGKGNSPETAVQLLSSNVGGYAEISQIDPNVFIFARNGMGLFRSNDKGFTASEDFLAASGMTNDSSLLTPFLLWENFNDINSRDSVKHAVKENTTANSNLTIRSKNGGYPFNYNTPVDVTAGDSIMVQDVVAAKFFLGVTNSIYLTKRIHDFTQLPEWFKIASIVGMPQSMAYSKDANYLFVGTTRGKLYRISNIALAYNFARADISSTECIIATSLIQSFNGRVITSISVDPQNDAHIIVTLGNYGNNDYVYNSTNALDEFPSFASVQGTLAKIPVYTSLIERTNSNRVMIGTDYGVFTCENIGGSNEWVKENNGMGEVPVLKIRQQILDRPWSEGIETTKNLGVIYIATNGRGLFESRSLVGIPDLPGTVAKNAVRIFPNPASSAVIISFKLAESSSASVKIYDLAGHLVKSVNIGMVKSGEQQYTLTTSDLSRGSYIVQLLAGTTNLSAKLVVVR